MGVTTTVPELRTLLASDEPPVVLDVRWALGDPRGRDHYAAGHIPGAVYVDLDTELAAPPSPEGGRHPLPRAEDLQEAARRWGIRQGRRVVVHDDSGNTAAARAWWLLRHAGLTRVTLLDGALGAWRSAGLPLESGVPADPPPGDVVLNEGALPTVDADGAAELAVSGLLLDARAAERYRGEVEPVDPRAGHIPGAVCAPTGENLTADGTFLPPEELRKRFEDKGAGRASRIGVYCGSGVTAAHQIAALEIAGFEAVLFPGSWSAWSADPARPAATGPLPS
ncbi:MULTISPECIES: sulfurtransferase [unclassified Streptomyces]|uniref:sulfurtransferase n=1 Tax=unclassified Streptomyces TaxID=2593676 RepID=UPI00236669F2|nr:MULTISPECIES: sulfurtransferase [unclassified Streptomyces]MDF3149014.1 sulfurtransferase [Streptomyces sp. T21Q-yed]WDF43816.1 sulfurtransferase [Streptomyces sp. T12]